MFTVEESRALLIAADIFFEAYDEQPEQFRQCINLNDAMYWACSDAEQVTDEELPRVAELFHNYGWCGVLYWVAVEKRGGEVPEFVDVKRFIEFVKAEETLRKEHPSSSKRAYLKHTYTIGAE